MHTIFGQRAVREEIIGRLICIFQDNIKMDLYK